MLHGFQDVDARDRRGHDESKVLRIGIRTEVQEQKRPANSQQSHRMNYASGNFGEAAALSGAARRPRAKAADTSPQGYGASAAGAILNGAVSLRS
jgi:hypothetical protein